MRQIEILLLGGLVSGLGTGLGAAPQFAPKPPPVEVRSGEALEAGSPRVAAPAADGSVRWDIGDPTDEEQLLLERINRTRMNPAAETAILRDHPDIQIQQAYRFFLVDFSRMAADMEKYVPVPPLAPHPALVEAARGHSQWMLLNVEQSHFQGSIGVGQRVSAVGYPWQTLGENVYAHSESAEHAHAGLEVDWGLLDGEGRPIAPGMQEPPGHRDSNHNPAFREVGIGLVKGRNSKVVNGQVATVGPLLFTVDFSNRQGAPGAVTGVTYFDLNSNGRYDEGEGWDGARVDVEGSTYHAVTARSGGYAVPAADGTRRVTFSAAGMEPVMREVALVNGANVKEDLRLDYVAPVLKGPTTVAMGRPNAWVPTAVPGATAFRWNALKTAPVGFTWNAEAGTQRLQIQQSAGYQVVQASRRASGTYGYRMTTPEARDQWMRLDGLFLGGLQPRIRFAAAMGFATSDQGLVLEISDEEGEKWEPVWRLPGRFADIDPAFVTRTVELPAMVGRQFQVRFRFEVGLGSFYNTVESGEGVYLDNIELLDISGVSPIASGEVEAGRAIAFTPTEIGQAALTIRPRVGTREFPFGATMPITVVQAALPPVIRLAVPELPDGNRIRLRFVVESGSPSGYILERAESVMGPWLAVEGFQLTSEASGSLRFEAPRQSGTGLYRIRMP
jgi:hypothetical protein